MEVRMNTADLIRKLCNEQNISITALARKIGQSPQNFGKKLKRNTVSQSELIRIADALGVIYEQTFTSHSEGDMNEVSNYNSLINKYVSNELGLTIQPEENDSESLDNNYMKLDNNAFVKINALLYNVPHYTAEFRAKQLSEDTYKVIYDKGLGHLQQSAQNRERFRANVVAFGTNNDITGQAELEKFHLKISSLALVTFDIATIVTNQYYLAKIDSKLSSLDDKLDHVQKFLEESKKSDLWANGQFLKDVSSKLYEITLDEQYRLTTLINVQSIRISTLSNVKFYHKMMQEYVKGKLDKNLKKFSDTQDVLKQFYEHFDAYLYSIYVYGFAYIIEIVLAQISEKEFLNKVRDEIQSVINSFQNDYTRELQQFIDGVKSLNPGSLTEAFSGCKPKFHNYGNSWGTLLLEAVTLMANLAATHDKEKKNSQKDEIERQFQFLQKRTKICISDLEFPIQAIEQLNKIYNEPLELLVTGDAAYLHVNNKLL